VLAELVGGGAVRGEVGDVHLDVDQPGAVRRRRPDAHLLGGGRTGQREGQPGGQPEGGE
jgi:hypothetical protein